jgi:cysteine desulfurase
MKKGFNMRYLDFAATTPIDQEALQVYMEVAQSFYGNTHSLHDIGSKAAQLLENCRLTLANILNVPKEGIHFTTGGTEANQLALFTFAWSIKDGKNHMITTKGEHSSIRSTFPLLERLGVEITELSLTSTGEIDLKQLENEIRPSTFLVATHHVNGETGVVQPIDELKKILAPHDIWLHVDCVQSFGKLPLSSIVSNVDSLSISSHKIYGPKGVGALYIRPNLYIHALFAQTPSDNRLRGGTVDLPSIAAFVYAAKKAESNQQAYYALGARLRKVFLNKLTSPSIRIIQHHDAVKQLPHVIGCIIDGMEGSYVMLEANRHQFAISTGSACQIGMQQPSKTLTSMGISEEQAKQFIRLSVGKTTTEQDMIDFASFLHHICH